MKKEQIKWLFPTPIQEYDLSEYLTADIARALQAVRHTENSLVDGIRGDVDPSQIPECKKLYKIFQTCIDDYSQRIGIQTSYIYESWMNILTFNGSVGVHRHYGSIISAAFYPYVEPNSAPLIFVNPLEGFRMMDVQSVNLDTFTHYVSNIEGFEPFTGKLVLFPSWVQHYVPPNKSNLRVTLSFNTQFKT